MEQESATTLGATLGTDRCGHCGGSVRHGAPWCTLCLTPTSTSTGASAPPEPPAPAAREGRPVLDPLTAPLELLAPDLARTRRPRGKHAAPSDLDLAGWPCAACQTPNPLDATACTACGTGFLEAVARTEPPLLVLPWLGDVSRLNKLHWGGLGVALLLVLLVVIVVGGALLG